MKIATQNGPERHMVTASAKMLADGTIRVHLVMDPGQAEQRIVGEAEFRADSPEAAGELIRQCANLIPRMIKQVMGAPNIIQAPAGLADKVKTQ